MISYSLSGDIDHWNRTKCVTESQLILCCCLVQGASSYLLSVSHFLAIVRVMHLQKNALRSMGQDFM